MGGCDVRSSRWIVRGGFDDSLEEVEIGDCTSSYPDRLHEREVLSGNKWHGLRNEFILKLSLRQLYRRTQASHVLTKIQRKDAKQWQPAELGRQIEKGNPGKTGKQWQSAELVHEKVKRAALQWMQEAVKRKSSKEWQPAGLVRQRAKSRRESRKSFVETGRERWLLTSKT